MSKEQSSIITHITNKTEEIKRTIGLQVFAIAALGLASIVPVEANTNFSVTAQNKIVKGEDNASLDIVATHQFNDKIGGSGYYLVGKNWSEVYVGPTYSPAPWSQFGVSLGMETADKPARAAASAWFGKGRHSLLGIVEAGGSGKWYVVDYQALIGRGIKAGIIFKRFLGLGPQVSLDIPKTPVTVNGAITYDHEAKQIKGVIKSTARF